MGLSTMKNNICDLVLKFEKLLGFRNKIKWKTFFIISFFHVFGFYWCNLHAFPVKWQSVAFCIWMLYVSGAGIICGAHRLWTHKCYSASLPLRIGLMLAFSSAGQNSIYEWVRDHRVHHKFSDTEADPHNINRGFFFAHIGWLMMKKNNLVLEKGRQMDMSDILRDPVAMFEHKYSNLLSFICCYVIPTATGILLWGERWQCAVAWQCFIRVLLVLHSEMTVNSLAHMYGYKPYNKNLRPAQNIFVSAVSGGEGWHNYHHMFPVDYKAAEAHDIFNVHTSTIRLFAKLGLAWDLKEPNPELVKAVKNRPDKSESNPEVVDTLDGNDSTKVRRVRESLLSCATLARG